MASLILQPLHYAVGHATPTNFTDTVALTLNGRLPWKKGQKNPVCVRITPARNQRGNTVGANIRFVAADGSAVCTLPLMFGAGQWLHNDLLRRLKGVDKFTVSDPGRDPWFTKALRATVCAMRPNMLNHVRPQPIAQTWSAELDESRPLTTTIEGKIVPVVPASHQQIMTRWNSQRMTRAEFEAKMFSPRRWLWNDVTLPAARAVRHALRATKNKRYFITQRGPK